MKIARVDVFVCAVCLWPKVALAQASRIQNLPTPSVRSIAKKHPDDRANLRITLRVDDFANLDPSVLTGARKLTTEIFAEAGVQTVWLDCPVYRADCGAEAERPLFMLRILRASIDENIVGAESLGFSIPCEITDRACLCYILYSRIWALAAEQKLGSARMLGLVLAHEIGHELLGPNPHEPFSIMQAKFSIEETERTLYFTSGQSRRLRAELLARKRAANR
jgi:hypothetical protein